MIIVDAIVLQVPTTVLSFGSNGDIKFDTFVRGYKVMEKIQMSGFVVQEIILSSLYIIQAADLLRHSLRHDSRKFLVQLISINVVVVIMDVSLLATEAASLYLFEIVLKGAIYSIKLKLEFAVLGKLIHFVGGRPGLGNGNRSRWSEVCKSYTGQQSHNPEPYTELDNAGIPRDTPAPDFQPLVEPDEQKYGPLTNTTAITNQGFKMDQVVPGVVSLATKLISRCLSTWMILSCKRARQMIDVATK